MANHTVTFPVTDPQEILKLQAGDEVTVPEPVPTFVTVTPEQLIAVVAEALPEPPAELVKLAAFV